MLHVPLNLNERFVNYCVYTGVSACWHLRCQYVQLSPGVGKQPQCVMSLCVKLYGWYTAASPAYEAVHKRSRQAPLPFITGGAISSSALTLQAALVAAAVG